MRREVSAALRILKLSRQKIRRNRMFGLPPAKPTLRSTVDADAAHSFFCGCCCCVLVCLRRAEQSIDFFELLCPLIAVRRALVCALHCALQFALLAKDRMHCMTCTDSISSISISSQWHWQWPVATRALRWALAKQRSQARQLVVRNWWCLWIECARTRFIAR